MFLIAAFEAPVPETPGQRLPRDAGRVFLDDFDLAHVGSIETEIISPEERPHKWAQGDGSLLER